jgi:DNA-binding transcriptional MerR regulator
LPTPARTASGCRRYDRAHLTRLAFIRRVLAPGFSLDEVRTY